MKVDVWVFDSRETEGLRAQGSRFHLRRVLALHLGLKPDEILIETDDLGKPRTTGCAFSISHSGSWLVIAVADREIGIDIETRTPRLDPLELAHRYFSEADAEILRGSANRGRDFRMQWVAKEAALKAAGVGIAGGLKNARCVFDGAEVSAVTWDAWFYTIRGFALADGTPGALAVPRGVDADIRWKDVRVLDAC